MIRRRRLRTVTTVARDPRAARWATVVMYGLHVAAGVFAAFFPSKAVQAGLPSWAIYVWAAFFFIGGILCLFGVLTPRWYGKLVGLPLLVGAVSTYGAALILQYAVQRDGTFLFVGCLLLALAAGLFERFVHVQRKFTAIVQNASDPKGDYHR